MSPTTKKGNDIMNIRKEIKVDFSESEIRAIGMVAKMADEFSTFCGNNPECSKCPLNEFCNNESIEQRVETIKNNIINFLK